MTRILDFDTIKFNSSNCSSLVVETLLKGNTLNAVAEDACLESLLQLGYHLQTQVAIFLKTWKPRHDVTEKTRRLMEDFLGTRAKKYSQITIGALQAERNKARKWKNLQPRGGDEGGGRGGKRSRGGRGRGRGGYRGRGKMN